MRVVPYVIMGWIVLSACTSTSVCAPGASQACACPNARAGAQECGPDGKRWQECVCAEPKITPQSPPIAEMIESTVVVARKIAAAAEMYMAENEGCLDLHQIEADPSPLSDSR